MNAPGSAQTIKYKLKDPGSIGYVLMELTGTELGYYCNENGSCILLNEEGGYSGSKAWSFFEPLVEGKILFNSTEGLFKEFPYEFDMAEFTLIE